MRHEFQKIVGMRLDKNSYKMGHLGEKLSFHFEKPPKIEIHGWNMPKILIEMKLYEGFI